MVGPDVKWGPRGGLRGGMEGGKYIIESVHRKNGRIEMPCIYVIP